jgi:hypothetical protein
MDAAGDLLVVENISSRSECFLYRIESKGIDFLLFGSTMAREPP